MCYRLVMYENAVTLEHQEPVRGHIYAPINGVRFVGMGRDEMERLRELLPEYCVSSTFPGDLY